MRLLCLTIAATFLTAAAVCADELVLKSGGRITGQVAQVATDAGDGYRVTTASGATYVFDRSQVAKVDQPSAEQQAYSARALAAPDTAEGQLALARWCRDNRLSQEAERHVQRVIELDPTNAEARSMLNFRNIDGKWQTREQLMESRGMVWYEGKYRTRQEIALMERDKRLKELETHWNGEIRKWRRWLGDRRPERVQEAVANFNRVVDPLAGPPIVNLLAGERDPQVRRLLARAAGRIDHQSTVNALVTLSLSDPDEELRYQCLEALIKSGRAGLTESYVKALRSKENHIVNRAAAALAELGDPSAISPLIGVLITEHAIVIGGTAGGGDTYSFEPTSGGFSFGGGGPQTRTIPRKNPDVLTALVRLSGGENYGYNEALWKKWHATQARLVQVDLRRDE